MPPRQSPHSPASGPDVPAPGIDLVPALNAAGETAYLWDFASDTIAWAGNAAQLLKVAEPNNLNSGNAFHQLIDSDYASQHYEAIHNASGTDDEDGIRFFIQYKFRPNGRRNPESLWVENHGKCFRGPTGKPAFARGIIRVINQRYQKEQRLLYLSRHDELTGHLNRIALTEELSDALSELKEENGCGAFIMVAVRNLTHVNDVYGFDIGDEMIQIVGKRLRAGLREGDAIGRYSSNKFGLLLRHSGPEELEIITKRFCEAIGDSVIETTAGVLTARIRQGCVILPQQADTVPLLLSRSLEALERAKTSHNHSIAMYEPCAQRESQRQTNMAMADRIIRALNERRMILALQPIVSSFERKPVYYEALVRMREPDGTIVPAGEFIPIAERLGLVRLIDHRVLELCIQLLKGSPNLVLALNVSGETASDGAWLNALQGLAKGEQSLTRRMLVEITETAAITDIEQSISFVKSLKTLGCRVAIDDFGAGYSSLQKLRQLDFDSLKIDGVFVRNLPNSPDDQILVRALIDLAHNFAMDTVAEWVTDEATAKLVEKAGVSYMQGYHLGEPRLVDFEQSAPLQSQAS